MRPDRLIALAAACVAAPTAAEPAMTLGVATHFAQGWPTSLLRDARAVGTTEIRDDVFWAKGEPAPGRYDLPAVTAPLSRACTAGFRVLIAVDPSHPAYDGGARGASAGGRAAFARFVAAVLGRLPAGCVSGLEIGNELNSIDAMQGAQALRDYAATLAAVRAAVPAGIAIVGGSTNAIGTGWLAGLIDAGGFATMDAVAVHPYRATPETVEVELTNLSALMARRGVTRPVWATEFGDYFADPALAPPHMVKMVMLMAAAGVRHMDWYALRDEPQFANMGLFDLAGRRKPAADAFALLQRELAAGVPRWVDEGDRRTFVFALAGGGHVIWGDPRPIAFQAFTGATDSRGEPVARPTVLTDDPVILAPGTRFTLGAGEVVADSLTEYDSPPWSYRAQTGDAAAVPLAMTDTRWASSYARADLRPLYIGATALVPAGTAATPVRAIVRYTAPADERVTIAACLAKKPGGDGVAVRVSAGATRLFEGVVSRELTLPRLTVSLARGATLDFAFAPAGAWGAEDVSYRIRLLTPGRTVAAECPA